MKIFSCFFLVLVISFAISNLIFDFVHADQKIAHEDAHHLRLPRQLVSSPGFGSERLLSAEDYAYIAINPKVVLRIVASCAKVDIGNPSSCLLSHFSRIRVSEDWEYIISSVCHSAPRHTLPIVEKSVFNAMDYCHSIGEQVLQEEATRAAMGYIEILGARPCWSSLCSQYNNLLSISQINNDAPSYTSVPHKENNRDAWIGFGAMSVGGVLVVVAAWLATGRTVNLAHTIQGSTITDIIEMVKAAIAPKDEKAEEGNLDCFESGGVETTDQEEVDSQETSEPSI